MNEITICHAGGRFVYENQQPVTNQEDAEEIAAMVAVNQVWNEPGEKETICKKEEKKNFSTNQDDEEISAMLFCYRTDAVEN